MLGSTVTTQTLTVGWTHEYILSTLVWKFKTAWGHYPSPSEPMCGSAGDLGIVLAAQSWSRRRRRSDLRFLPAVHHCLKKKHWWSQVYPGISALGSEEAACWSLGYPGSSVFVSVCGRSPSLLMGRKRHWHLSLGLSRGTGCLGLLSSAVLPTQWCWWS